MVLGGEAAELVGRFPVCRGWAGVQEARGFKGSRGVVLRSSTTRQLEMRACCCTPCICSRVASQSLVSSIPCACRIPFVPLHCMCILAPFVSSHLKFFSSYFQEEGIVVKALDTPYEFNDRNNWIKASAQAAWPARRVPAGVVLQAPKSPPYLNQSI